MARLQAVAATNDGFELAVLTCVSAERATYSAPPNPAPTPT